MLTMLTHTHAHTCMHADAHAPPQPPPQQHTQTHTPNTHTHTVPLLFISFSPSNSLNLVTRNVPQHVKPIKEGTQLPRTVVQYSCMGWLSLCPLTTRPEKKQFWHMSKLKHFRQRYLTTEMTKMVETHMKSQGESTESIGTLFHTQSFRCSFSFQSQISQ